MTANLIGCFQVALLLKGQEALVLFLLIFLSKNMVFKKGYEALLLVCPRTGLRSFIMCQEQFLSGAAGLTAH
jgi:hypothetical protein